MASGAENQAINVLRTIAAVLVVMGHLRALFFLDWADVPHTALAGSFYVVTGLGHEAVMVFFVLSGFWVGGTVVASVRAQTFQWSDYAVRRLSRLWLVVIPGLILTAFCSVMTLEFFATSDVATGSAAYHNVAPSHLVDRLAPLNAIGNAFFLQGIVVPTYGSNGPLWSLAYEFWFYVMFPLLLLAVMGPRWRSRAGSGILLAACAVFVGPTIVLYFAIWLLGALVAIQRQVIAAWLASRRRMVVVSMQVGAAVLLASSMAAASVRFLGPFGDPITALATAALLALLVSDPRPGGVFGYVFRGAGRYAEASFSLYVVHLPILALLAAATIPSAEARFLPSLGGIAFFVGVLVGTLIVGWLFAYLTEFHTTSMRRWVSIRLRVVRPGSSGQA